MTRPVIDVPPATADCIAHLPESLASVQPMPELIRHVGFFAGLLVYWMRPRRLGPHLAAGSLVSACSAGLISLCVSTSIVYFAFLAGRMDWQHGLLGLRSTLARLVLEVAAGTAGSNWNWVAAVVFLTLPMETLLVFAFLGIVLFPWAADGDAYGSAVARSVKVTLWSMSVLIPLSIVWTSSHFALSRYYYTGLEPVQRNSYAEAIMPRSDAANAGASTDITINHRGERICYGVLPILFVIAYLRLYFIGSARYAGPPNGPGFALREPRCRRCGYSLRRAMLSSNCAECGTPVGDSIPPRVSAAAPWNSDFVDGRFLTEFFRMQLRVLKESRFLQTIPVHAHWSAARSFWWTTCACFSSCLFVLLWVGMLVAGNESPEFGDYLVLGGASLFPLAIHAAGTFILSLWARIRHGIRDARVALILNCYASALFWPWVLMLAVAVDVYALTHSTTSVFQSLQMYPDSIGILLVVVIAGFLASVGVWWIRLSWALRAVRFANF